jgi:hypothetical protein
VGTAGDRIPRRGDVGQRIGAALSLVPERILPLVSCRFYCGVDPVFAGLTTYGEDAVNGVDVGGARGSRSLRDTEHVLYESYGWVPRTTVVLQERKPIPVMFIVHELGHVLHESIGFEHVAEPVTRYGQKSDHEAFAEAFTAWLSPDYPRWTRDALSRDRATVELFDRLERT